MAAETRVTSASTAIRLGIERFQIEVGEQMLNEIVASADLRGPEIPIGVDEPRSVLGPEVARRAGQGGISS